MNLTGLVTPKRHRNSGSDIIHNSMYIPGEIWILPLAEEESFPIYELPSQ